MKKLRKLSYDDICLLKREYSSGDFLESADYVVSFLTKK